MAKGRGTGEFGAFDMSPTVELHMYREGRAVFSRRSCEGCGDTLPDDAIVAFYPRSNGRQIFKYCNKCGYEVARRNQNSVNTIIDIGGNYDMRSCETGVPGGKGPVQNPVPPRDLA